jgi:hypothetical protein
LRTLAFCGLLFLFGCVSENTRVLVDQTEKAGQKILDLASDSAVKGAASDVVANSGSVLDVIGKPKNPVPYSPGASASARTSAQAEKSTRGIFAWLGSVLSSIPVPWAAAVGSVLSAFVFWRSGASTSSRLQNVFAAVDSAVEKVDPAVKEQIVSVLRSSAQATGDYLQNKSDLAALRLDKQKAA